MDTFDFDVEKEDSETVTYSQTKKTGVKGRKSRTNKKNNDKTYKCNNSKCRDVQSTNTKNLRKRLIVSNSKSVVSATRNLRKRTSLLELQVDYDIAQLMHCKLCEGEGDVSEHFHSTRNSHAWGHTGIKPLLCSVCGLGFNYNGMWKARKHLHTSHSGIEGQIVDERQQYHHMYLEIRQQCFPTEILRKARGSTVRQSNISETIEEVANATAINMSNDFESDLHPSTGVQVLEIEKQPNILPCSIQIIVNEEEKEPDAVTDCPMEKAPKTTSVPCELTNSQLNDCCVKSVSTRIDYICVHCNKMLKKANCPKIVPCFHLICLDCFKSKIDYFKQILCPKCNETFPKENVHEFKLIEGPQLPLCTACSTTDGSLYYATHYCSDCQENLCANCVKFHKRSKFAKDHQLKMLFSEDMQCSNTCTVHPSNNLDIFCTTCTIVVCCECFLADHNSHGHEKMQDKISLLQLQYGNNAIQLSDEIKHIKEPSNDSLQKLENSYEKAKNELEKQCNNFQKLLDKIKEQTLSEINEDFMREKRHFSDKQNGLLTLKERFSQCKRFAETLSNYKGGILDSKESIFDSLLNHFMELQTRKDQLKVPSQTNYTEENIEKLFQLNLFEENRVEQFFAEAIQCRMIESVQLNSANEERVSAEAPPPFVLVEPISQTEHDEIPLDLTVIYTKSEDQRRENDDGPLDLTVNHTNSTNQQQTPPTLDVFSFDSSIPKEMFDENLSNLTKSPFKSLAIGETKPTLTILPFKAPIKQTPTESPPTLSILVSILAKATEAVSRAPPTFPSIDALLANQKRPSCENPPSDSIQASNHYKWLTNP